MVICISNNYNYIIACNGKNGFYIESRLYNSFVTYSSEAVNEMIDNLVDFCGRGISSILDKVGSGEFILKELND